MPMPPQEPPPISPMVRNLLVKAETFAQSGAVADAAAWLQESLELMPGEPMIHLKLAAYLTALRHMVPAAAHYEAALEGMPGVMQVQIDAAHGVNKAGDYVRARQIFEAAWRMHGDAVLRHEPPFHDSLYIPHYGEEAVRERRFLNIGAGVWGHWAWRIVDLDHPNYPRNTPDIVHDLMDGRDIPLPDETAKLIFCSHCLEHLPQPAAMKALEEIYRLLEPGGVFRMTVPDVDLAYAAYARNDLAYFLREWPICKELGHQGMRDLPIAQHFVATVATYLTDTAPDFSTLPVVSPEELESLLQQHGLEAALDDLCARVPPDYQRRYPNAHLNWFTFAKAERVLRDVGFDRVALSAYGRSTVPVMRYLNLFDCTYPVASLHVEAFKD